MGLDFLKFSILDKTVYPGCKTLVLFGVDSPGHAASNDVLQRGGPGGLLVGKSLKSGFESMLILRYPELEFLLGGGLGGPHPLREDERRRPGADRTPPARPGSRTLDSIRSDFGPGRLELYPNPDHVWHMGGRGPTRPFQRRIAVPFLSSNGSANPEKPKKSENPDVRTRPADPDEVRGGGHVFFRS